MKKQFNSTLDEEIINALKRLAKKRGINASNLISIWVTEAAEKEGIEVDIKY